MLTFMCTLSIMALYFGAIFWGRFWSPLVDEPEPVPTTWPAVDIIIPARNEAETLPETLPSLLSQDYPGPYRIILVDDHSADSTPMTAERVARNAGASNKLTVLSAPDLPEGWVGKVAAMQAGLATSKAPFVLFTDADIVYQGGTLRQLVSKAELHKYDLTSLMVKLNIESLAEKFLIPAFVFFFTMLYPFRKVDDPASKIAGAAGGVMLVRREMLDKSGGLEAIKGALIDDCSLARSIKKADGHISLALTQEVQSVRKYPTAIDIREMIARTAFTQLRHSYALLLLALFGMFAVFIAPVLAFLTLETNMMFVGGIAWFVMAALYAPTVVFYGLPVPWAATLPAAAGFYMIAMIESARNAFLGQGGRWKGRTNAP